MTTKQKTYLVVAAILMVGGFFNWRIWSKALADPPTPVSTGVTTIYTPHEQGETYYLFTIRLNSGKTFLVEGTHVNNVTSPGVFMIKNVDHIVFSTPDTNVKDWDKVPVAQATL